MHGPTRWGDGEFCPGGGHRLESVCGGVAAPISAGAQAGGTGIPAQEAVAA